MRRKNLVTVGFLSVLTATLVLTPSTFAAETQGKKERTKENAAPKNTKQMGGQERVDVMEQPPKKGVQSDSMTPGKEKRTDVIEDVGSQGDVYPSTGGSTRKDVIDTIRN
ncbi:hypothetical protein [Nitrospira sp. BLG_2]|uniref:hypothetical protein n=1 Tax=Nitrospira sp. BLG_2 TaxID=3397507 RepID=UPI003B99D7A2